MAADNAKTVLALLFAVGVASQFDARPKDGPPVRADRHADPLPEGAIQRLGTVRLRSPGGVECVAFTPDGKGLLSSCWDGAVRLWDPATGKELRRFEGHKRAAGHLAVSSDGKTMATTDFDGILRIWDLPGGKLRVRSPVRTAFRVAFSPKGDLLVSVGNTRTLCLWDPATGQEIRRTAPLTQGDEIAGFRSIAFSQDGKVVAAGTDIGIEKPNRPGVTGVWDVATGKILHALGGHRGGVTSVAFGQDGKLLASASHDTTIRFWDTATGKERLAINAPDDPGVPRDPRSEILGLRTAAVLCVAFSPDGKALASGHKDGSVRLWESATGKALHALRGHGREVVTIAFSPDGKALASASPDHTIRIWDPATGKLRSPREGHDGGVTRIAVTPEGKRVATAGIDRTVRLWNLATGQEVAALTGRGVTRGSAVAASPDGKLLATADDETICLWDAATGKVVRQLDGHARGVQSLDFSPDGKSLASAAANEKEGQPVRLWDVGTGGESRPVEARGYYYSVGFSPDGKWLAGHEINQGIDVWDAATGKRRHRFEDLIAFAFLAGSEALVGWGKADEVSVRSLETGRKLYGFQGPDRVKHLGVSFALSPDGRLLAFFPASKDLQLWEVATGKLRSTFEGGTRFGGLAITPDGRALLSAREDTTVLVWGLAGQAEGARPSLTEKELTAFWADLAAVDGVRAGRAVRLLAANAGRAVAILKARLRPTPAADPGRLAALVADLDADQFAVRDKATRDLKALGELAEPALRKALGGSPSLDARRRMDDLLEAAAGPIADPEKAREVRAVEVLERVGTPEAAEVLRGLAKGAPAAWLTREAKAALNRLRMSSR